MKKNAVELIIFDLDGTLINSVPDLTETLNASLKLNKKDLFTEQDVQKMVGSGIRKLLEDAIKQINSSIPLEELLTTFKEEYAINLKEKKATTYSLVEETLQKLTTYKKAVLSNKLDVFTKQIITDLNFDSYFDIVLGANIEKYQTKPSSEGIEYILKSLNIKPENALMIGDSTHDIHAAKNANIKSCAVTYGYRSKEILAKEKPDYIINSISEILDVLT